MVNLKKNLVVCAIYGLNILVVFGAPGGHDVDMVINDRTPSFVTPGQTYRIATGATVVLPCRVTEPGSYVLAWKRGIAVLTAGPVKVTPDPRVRLLSSPPGTADLPGLPGLAGGGYSLELRDVRPQDAGDYVCQIGTLVPKEITHTLEILVPPRIHHVSHSGSLDVLQGATVKLECRASGNPVPTIAWTRKNNVLPSGERSVSGISMVIQHADRHSAGQYTCSADNGVGQPETRHITLNVLYAPEVETERSTIHTGLGLEAQLVCIVHAQPAPIITWFKDSAQISTTEQHVEQNRGNRYTMVIRNVSNGDFGNYSCVASNAHGKARGHMQLTGVASSAVFESPTVSLSKDSYNISWVVGSHAAVTEFRLYFRPQPQQHRTHRQHDEMNMIHRMVYFQDTINNNLTTLMSYRNEWNSVVLPGPYQSSPYQVPGSVPAPFPSVTRQRMWYLIRGLQPGGHYEARVQAKNVHGWNKLSPVFHFSTRSADMEHIVEPSAQPAVYGDLGNRDLGMAAYNTAYRSTVHLSVFAISIAILIGALHRT